MSAFTTPDGKKSSVFNASQESVPGEPIFVMVVDDSTSEKESLCVTTVTLGWMTEQMYTSLHDSRYGGPDYRELYVLFPKGDDFPKFPGLVRCDVGASASRKPDGGHRMILTNQIGVLWSCEI